MTLKSKRYGFRLQKDIRLFTAADVTAMNALTGMETYDRCTLDNDDEYEYRGSTAGWVQTKSGGAQHTEPNQLANERNPGETNQYGVSVEEWTYTLWAHDDGDTVISSQPVLLRAIIETSALTGDVTLRDGTTAAGTSFGVYAASQDFYGIKLNSGLFIDDNATAGQLMIIWREQ